MLQQVQTLQLGLKLALVSLALRDVACNFRCADDSALSVAERRDGGGYVDSPAVRPHPDGLEMVHRFAARDPPENRRLLFEPLRRNEPLHGLTDGFVRREAEELLSRGIPRGDYAVQSLADDGIVRGRDDAFEQLPAGARTLLRPRTFDDLRLEALCRPGQFVGPCQHPLLESIMGALQLRGLALDAACHGVEALAQAPEFVGAVDGHPGGQIPARYRLRCL